MSTPEHGKFWQQMGDQTKAKQTEGSKQRLIAEYLYKELFPTDTQSKIESALRNFTHTGWTHFNQLKLLVRELYFAHQIGEKRSAITLTHNFSSSIIKAFGEANTDMMNVARLLIENHTITWQILTQINPNFAKDIRMMIQQEKESMRVPPEHIVEVIYAIMDLYFSSNNGRELFIQFMQSIYTAYLEDPYTKRFALPFDHDLQHEVSSRQLAYPAGYNGTSVNEWILNPKVENFFRLAFVGQSKVWEEIGNYGIRGFFEDFSHLHLQSKKLATVSE